MAKWIVEAVPIPGHMDTKGALPDTRSFDTTAAAKKFARKKFDQHYYVTARTGPGITPAIEVGLSEAFRWSQTARRLSALRRARRDAEEDEMTTKDSMPSQRPRAR
jgi:hypothetical protein